LFHFESGCEEDFAFVLQPGQQVSIMMPVSTSCIKPPLNFRLLVRPMHAPFFFLFLVNCWCGACFCFFVTSWLRCRSDSTPTLPHIQQNNSRWFRHTLAQCPFPPHFRQASCGSVIWVAFCGLCVLLGGFHTVLFGCLCCCGGGVQLPPRGASVACCRLAWLFPRVSGLSVSSHLLHVTCVGDADLRTCSPVRKLPVPFQVLHTHRLGSLAYPGPTLCMLSRKSVGLVCSSL